MDLMAAENETEGMLYKSLTCKSPCVLLDTAPLSVPTLSVPEPTLSHIFDTNENIYCARLPASNEFKTVYRKLDSNLPDKINEFYIQNKNTMAVVCLIDV